MAILIITEKPDQGRTIAKFLGATKQSSGYLYNDKYIVTWAIGHIVELAPPSAYRENPWLLNSLPIIPTTFKKNVKASTKKQFKIIEKLVSNASSIINATDAAREGELIFRYILSQCKPKSCSIERLWISSYTDKDLKLAFDSLKPQSDYDGLYHAGKARSELDWIYGMNATIALTKKLEGNGVLSLGRVQTPTYCMVTKRYIDNDKFIAQATYTPTIHISYNDSTFEAKTETYFLEKKKAQGILDLTKGEIKCFFSEHKKTEVAPPMLFELTSLQMEAFDHFGLTAMQTLNATQALYEKHKMVTYPRTDSSYLGSNQKQPVFDLIREIASKIPNMATYIDFTNLPTKSFNDSKVTDHHAIIPTGEFTQLNGIERDVYSLILKRFMAHFSKNAIRSNLTYKFGSPEAYFVTRETTFVESRWRNIYNNSKDKSTTDLPILVQDSIQLISKKEIRESKTTAPPLLNTKTLTRLMATCGKDSSNDENPEFKKNGIGRSATRANIIERLIAVGYIQRSKRTIIPTEKGLKLYPLISTFDISDVELTGRVEEHLYSIQENRLSYNEFMSAITDRFVNKTMKEILSLETPKASDSSFVCPKCTTVSLQHFTGQYTCKNTNCSYSIKTTFLGQEIKPNILEKLLQGERVLMKNLSGKSKVKFDAYASLILDSGRIEPIFIDTKTEFECPKCKGILNERKTFYGCSNYKNGCDFSLFKNIAGYKLSTDDIKKLLSLEISQEIEKFKSKKTGKNFSAKIKLTGTYKVDLIFS